MLLNSSDFFLYRYTKKYLCFCLNLQLSRLNRNFNILWKRVFTCLYFCFCLFFFSHSTHNLYLIFFIFFNHVSTSLITILFFQSVGSLFISSLLNYVGISHSVGTLNPLLKQIYNSVGILIISILISHSAGTLFISIVSFHSVNILCINISTSPITTLLKMSFLPICLPHPKEPSPPPLIRG